MRDNADNIPKNVMQLLAQILQPNMQKLGYFSLILSVLVVIYMVVERARIMTAYENLLRKLRDKQVTDEVLENRLMACFERLNFYRFYRLIFQLDQLDLLTRDNIEKFLQFDAQRLCDALTLLQKSGEFSDRNCQCLLRYGLDQPEDMATAIIAFNKARFFDVSIYPLVATVRQPSTFTKIVCQLRSLTQDSYESCEIVSLFRDSMHLDIDNIVLCFDHLMDMQLLSRRCVQQIVTLDSSQIYTLGMLLTALDYRKIALNQTQLDLLLHNTISLEVVEYILNQCVENNDMNESDVHALLECRWLLSDIADEVLWREFPLGRLDGKKLQAIIQTVVSIQGRGMIPQPGDFSYILSQFEHVSSNFFPRKLIYFPLGKNAQALKQLVEREFVIPDAYCCAISGNVMTNPVRIQTLQEKLDKTKELVLESGCYELETLLFYLKRKPESPHSRQAINLSNTEEWLVPDSMLKKEIDQFMQSVRDGACQQTVEAAALC